MKVLVLFLAVIVISCSEDKPNGLVEVKVIKPIGARCRYTISPAPIETLYSLTNISGALGKVVYSSNEIESMDSIWNASPIFAQFSKNGSYYVPLDMDSLFSISLYYGIETAYFLFSRLNPEADIIKRFPNLGERTWFVYNAIMEDGSELVTDNAGYYPYYSDYYEYQDYYKFIPSNVFYFFPTKVISDMPMGLNIGIIAHEYSHLIMEHLFTMRVDLEGFQISDNSQMAFISLDEGIADYFGFLATSDPAFFLCSYPLENRDLSIPKRFTNEVLYNLSTNKYFDEHEGGAIFASIFYMIGEAIHSHERNGNYLIKLMLNLINCAKTAGSSIVIDIPTIARCHAGVAEGGDSAVIQSIYSRYIDSYGGNK